MKNTTSLIVLELLLSLTVVAQEVPKPEDRIQMGMTPDEVQRLVGSPLEQVWSYRRPVDGPTTEWIQVNFLDDRVTSFHMSHEDTSGQITIRDFSEDGIYYGLDYKADSAGPLVRHLYQLPASEMPVLYGDPPAKVLQLYGPPRRRRVCYPAALLTALFENGKLVRWTIER